MYGAGKWAPLDRNARWPKAQFATQRERAHTDSWHIMLSGWPLLWPWSAVSLPAAPRDSRSSLKSARPSLDADVRRGLPVPLRKVLHGSVAERGPESSR